jgi:hypothetical protein
LPPREGAVNERFSVKNVAITALITTVVTLLGTWVYSTITDKPRELQYRVSTTPPLPGRLANHAAYIFEISNPGEKESENIRFDVKFPQGEIREKSVVVPPGMDYKEPVLSAKDSYLLTAPILNPGDIVRVSIFTRYAQPLSSPPSPTVGLRARAPAFSRYVRLC